MTNDTKHAKIDERAICGEPIRRSNRKAAAFADGIEDTTCIVCLARARKMYEMPARLKVDARLAELRRVQKPRRSAEETRP